MYANQMEVAIGGDRLNKDVTKTIDTLVQELRAMQVNDGSWRFCFETGPMTDAYTIILLRTLEYEGEEWLIKQLVERLLHKQEKNGAWKLFRDEKEGHLSVTVEAYFALLYSGYVKEHSNNMKRAKAFILKHGGLTGTGPFTQAMLALNEQIRWPKLFKVPIELLLLPRSSPVNVYDIVSYSRVHLTAVLIPSTLDYSRKTKQTPDLSSLISSRVPNNAEFDTEESRLILQTIKNEIKKLLDAPKQLRKDALKKAERLLLERIEPDGLHFSYVSATVFMVFALLALGYSKKHPLITKAVNGIKNQVCLTTRFYHIEFATSTIWDTSQLSHALQQAGVPSADEMVVKANHYLLSRQHVLYGDWAFNNPSTLPGGWGFSDINTFLPDVDDTAASLRAVKQTVLEHPQYRNAWNRGLDWVMSMQNKDGGWAAFEKNTTKKRITLLPFPNAGRILLDPSTTDLTGRALEFLGNEANILLPHPQMEDAFRWLVKNQETDGSWYGRWGICYIYGTWAALTGMKAIGIDSSHASIKRGVNWLRSIQNNDGGWGESCYSDIRKVYVPLGASTLSQTAWAIDALVAAFDKPTEAIQRGVTYLIENLHRNDWTTNYPTGAAIPGHFYIYYHSYNYIWPLLALSNYRKKYESLR
ncbi:squalene--hopene cyclase [Alteribacter populi]|uniref:squalene--hopene cyclase n=1 Tax=Alteribacter populi TaxID=2011011 RepID=UPI001E2FBEFE|nr:squalene--hopene cyclase [Alteribacter populi]